MCMPATYVYTCECMCILWHPFPLPFPSPSLSNLHLKSPLIKSLFVFCYLVSSSCKNHNALPLHVSLPLLLVPYFCLRRTASLTPIATLVRMTGKERHKQKAHRQERAKGLTVKTDRPQTSTLPCANHTLTTLRSSHHGPHNASPVTVICNWP